METTARIESSLQTDLFYDSMLTTTFYKLSTLSPFFLHSFTLSLPLSLHSPTLHKPMFVSNILPPNNDTSQSGLKSFRPDKSVLELK